MAVEFYNVKKREKVGIDDSSIRKTVYKRALKDGGTQERYAFRATDDDGTNLTKFVKKADWDASNAPVE